MTPYYDKDGITIYNADYREILPELQSDSIDLICIDPPYIVTKEKWDKVDQVTPELSKELFRLLKPAGNFYCWGGVGEKSQTILKWFFVFKETGWYFKDWITWKKQRGMGNRRGWLYTREELLWNVKDNGKFYWNTDEQYSDQKRTFTATYKDKEKEAKYLSHVKSDFKRITNVWDDIREANISWNSKENECTHFTPKPIKAIERIIRSHTQQGELVLDCFMGSGTTLVSAKNLGRKAIGIEISKEYCDIAIARLEKSS